MTLRSVTGAAIAAAVLATSVTPAMAQSFPGGFPGGGYGNPGRGNSWNGQRHHRNRGVSAGDVIAGVAVIGILAAIASAASKSKTRNGDYNDRYRGNINSEDQAADACAAGAEQRFGNGARVTGIDQVNRTRDGYEVRGTIETRDYRNSDTQRFTCQIRYGDISDVRIDDGYAYRGY
jgi:hypothetical protein